MEEARVIGGEGGRSTCCLGSLLCCHSGSSRWPRASEPSWAGARPDKGVSLQHAGCPPGVAVCLGLELERVGVGRVTRALGDMRRAAASAVKEIQGCYVPGRQLARVLTPRELRFHSGATWPTMAARSRHIQRPQVHTRATCCSGIATIFASSCCSSG